MKKQKSIYVAFIFLQSILYGIGNPVTKIAFESISVYWCLAVRFSLAFLLFFVVFRKQIIKEIRKARVRDYLPASLCMAAAYISVNLALNWTSATTVGFLMSLPVIIAPILSKIVLKTKHELRHLPVQLAVIVGLYLLCCTEGGFSFGKGELLALITAVSIAGALVFGEKSLNDMSAATVSAAQAGMTAAISIVMAVISGPLHIGQTTPAAWTVVVYLAVGCTFAAYLLQNIAVDHLSSTTVSMLQTTQPVATAVCSFLILGETLTGRGYAGAVIIIICILTESLIAWRE